MITKLATKAITTLLPAARWYRAAFVFTKYYAKVSKAPFGSWVRERYANSLRMNHAMKLETLLGAMAAGATVPIFPIPVRAAGEKLWDFSKSRPNGLLLCSVHTPLSLAGVRHFIDQGLVIDGIIANYPPAEGYYAIPGTPVRIPALTVDRTILLKVKGILKRGGTVISMVDDLADGQFSPNQFQLAAKLDADIMLVLVELLPDGSIRNTLLEAPEATSAADALTHKITHLNKQARHLMSEWH